MGELRSSVEDIELLTVCPAPSDELEPSGNEAMGRKALGESATKIGDEARQTAKERGLGPSLNDLDLLCITYSFMFYKGRTVSPFLARLQAKLHSPVDDDDLSISSSYRCASL